MTNNRTIYIDARFLTQNITGVQRYARELVKALDTLVGSGQTNSLTFELLAPGYVPPNALLLSHIVTRRVGRMSGYGWEQLILPFASRGRLLFCPGNVGPVLSLLTSQRTVVTVHDLSYHYFPDASSRLFKMVYGTIIPIVLRKADAVITVSNSERDSIVSLYPFVASRIPAIQSGATVGQLGTITPVPSAAHTPFVLYVGSLQGVIRAASIANREQRVSFIVVGAGGKSFQQMHGDLPPDALKHIEFKGQIDDHAELMRLYRSAACLVFPSYYEASPLPPTEAMSCGCPVIASLIPSLQERCGDAAYYVDPDEPADTAKGILTVLADDEIRCSLIEKGLERAREFTWERTAREHLSIFRKVLGQ